MAPLPDPTKRFSDRVDDYERYRPRYPREVLDVLREVVDLSPGWTVADLGSGTGISAELFLDHGNRVLAVEPNDEMRAAAERRLAGRPGLSSVRGRAETTGLEAESVDLVVAAQAFHWFDVPAARVECRRISREPHRVVLLWNVRHTDGSPFLRDYESLLLTFATDYREVRHENAEERYGDFFAGAPLRRVFPNEQVLDRAGLRGRLLSSSYAPAASHPRHEAMVAALEDVFGRHEEGGLVRVTYDTEVVIGRV